MKRFPHFIYLLSAIFIVPLSSYAGKHKPPEPVTEGPPPTGLPIDTLVYILMISGLIYGLMIFYKTKKRQSEQ